MEYDCQACGACCVDYLDYFGHPGYVSLYEDEPERLRRFGLPVVEHDGAHLLGAVVHDGPGGGSVCVSFRGAVGGPCQCMIYEQRPGKCWHFTAGSPQCRLARRRAGLEA